MSHAVPHQQSPLVDVRSGRVTAVWFRFLNILGAIPQAKLSSTLTYDPPNLAAGATTTQAVTVTGASLGWDASAAFSLSLSGLIMTAYVSAASTVTVVLYNPTAGAVDLGSGTLTAFAWQP